MSVPVDLIDDCAAIIACLPELTVINVLAILESHSSEKRHQRIRLTLEDIFKNQDKQDSPTAQQNDIALVQKLLPDISKCRISSLMPYLGNEENRKAILLRLLLQDCVVDVKAAKHKLTDDVVSTSDSTDESKKRKTTNEDLSKAFDSCNNNNVTEIACNLNKADSHNKDNNRVDNHLDDDCISMNDIVLRIDASIFQPSTSRAVWNPYTGSYEEGPSEKRVGSNEVANANTSKAVWNPCTGSYGKGPSKKKVGCKEITNTNASRPVKNPYSGSYEEGPSEKKVANNEITNTNDTPMTDFKYVEETDGIVSVDWSEEFPTTTQQDVPKIVNTQFVDIKKEKMEVEVDSTANSKTIQDDIGGNQYVVEEHSMDSRGGTGASDFLETNQSGSLMEGMEFAGALNTNTLEVDNRLLYPLMEMFPQACPNYLRSICADLKFTEDTLNELSITLLTQDYPERGRPVTPEEKIDADEQFEILKQVLPDADPTFLRFQCEQLADNPDALKEFISDALENKNYPTMKEYLRKQQLSAQQKQYTSEFKVFKFLEVIPDPVTYFEDPKRQVRIPSTDMHFVCTFLRNEFCTLPVITIKSCAMTDGCGLLKIYRSLELKVKQKSVPLLKTKRKPVPLPDNCQNIPLLQEMAYIIHKQEILEYMKEQKKNEELERQYAKKNGLLRTCNCCFDDEILERDIVICENGCGFCKQCVQKSVEVAFGDGKLEFGCLTNCQSQFSLQTLQSALTPKLFSKLAQKKQMEEVKAAGIQELETCPFCDFATIPAENDRLFRCLNPECMKESCRECKEPSHIPLKCNEVEKDEDVKRRTYIENKMSEALLRKCHKCGKCFIKSDGCNKITCTCGALQCYVCGKPVTGYDHFNGQGGDKYHLCPLYSDTESLHEQAVLKVAEAAKAEVGVDAKNLKIDPTADIKNYYSEMKKKAAPLPPGVVNIGLLHNYAAAYPVGLPVNPPVIVAGLYPHQHHHYHHGRHGQPARRYRQRIPQPPAQPNNQPHRH